MGGGIDLDGRPDHDMWLSFQYPFYIEKARQAASRAVKH
jgi:hypothetical protein